MWIISSMFLVKNVAKSTYYIPTHRIVKKIHMKAWCYQYEMDFQWLKMRNKIRNNFHIKFLKIIISCIGNISMLIAFELLIWWCAIFLFLFWHYYVICFESTCRLHMHDKKKHCYHFKYPLWFHIFKNKSSVSFKIFFIKILNILQHE
jgi:hypothetical protein